jgi:outer membrane protein TolC
VLLLSCAKPQSPDWQSAGGPAPLSFPEGHRYSADELVEIALRRNAALDVARYEAEAVRGLVDQVKALWLPVIRYGFGVVVFDNDISYQVRALRAINVNVPITGNVNLLGEFSVGQILFTSGKRTSGLRQAELFARIKQLEVVHVRDGVALDVSNYYLLVLLTTDIDRVLDETVRRLRVFRQVSQELSQRGSQRSNRLDMLKAEYFIEQVEQGRVAAQAGRFEAFEALRQAAGLQRSEPMPLAAAALPPAPGAEEWLSVYAQIVKGFANRPELRQVDYLQKLRERQVEFAKAGYGPNVFFLGGGVQSVDNVNSIIDQDFLFASLFVDLPIYDPAQKGRLREALANRNAADAFQRQIEELITLEIEVTSVDAQKALANVLKAARAQATGAEHYQAARQAFSRELIDGQDLVTAIGLDSLARIQYLQAVYEYHFARAKLKRVTAEREERYGY